MGLAGLSLPRGRRRAQRLPCSPSERPCRRDRWGGRADRPVATRGRPYRRSDPALPRNPQSARLIPGGLELGVLLEGMQDLSRLLPDCL